MLRPNALLVALIALAFTSGCAAQAPGTAALKRVDPAATPALLKIPDADGLLVLIRSSLVALSQANMTNDYAVLSEMAAPSFRVANSPTRLAQLFEAFRTNNIDLAPVTVIAPQFAQAPRIEDGRLRLIGLFPSQPLQVNYDLSFEQVSGQWRLSGLSVNLVRSPAKI